MKKNLISLFGVAFVVALMATGVFYGLVAGKFASSQQVVPPQNPAATPEPSHVGASIPNGMRAVSIHVSDSTGIMQVLKPGSRVDVQVVAARGPEPELRTMVQNVEVWTIPNPDGGRPVVNLLVKPLEADLLALADSTARVRLTLRNPRDEQEQSSPAVRLGSSMRERSGG
jgi:Flp pilus assembly protein CpaB